MTHNYAIDRIKFLAAMAVVLIHVTAFLETEGLATFANYYWYRHLLNFAVPFFFATTGYLVAQQKDTTSYLRRYLTKILVMYVVFTLFYLLVDAFIFVPTSMAMGASFPNALLQYWHTLSWVKVGNGQIGHYHLWYLWALFLASLILYWWVKRGWNPTQILLGAVVIYLVGRWLITVNLHWELLANGGFPKALVSLVGGYYVAKRNLAWRGGLVTALIILFAYQALSLSDIHFFAGEFVLILAIWVLMTYVSARPGKSSPLSRWAAYSMEIYLFHPILLTIYSYSSNVEPDIEIQSHGWRVMLMTCTTVAVSIFLYPYFDRFYIQPVEKRLEPGFDRLVRKLT